MDGICLFLNGDRGVCVLRELLYQGHNVIQVILPQGKRGSDIALDVEDMNIATYYCYSVKEASFHKWFYDLNPNIAIVAGYSDIFPQYLVDIPFLGTINLHAGDLPFYRGGSPLNWQIINGETHAGLSVIQMDAGIDTGDILSKAEIPILKDSNIGQLHAQANQIFPSLVLEALSLLERGEQGTPQDIKFAAYWHQRSDADGQIFWRDMSAQQVHDQVRALSFPYPGAFSRLGEDVVRITQSELLEKDFCGVPGRILSVQRQGPIVICRDKGLLLKEYHFESNSSRQLNHGDRFD
ncbi:methionyl-tRNA formyltransferase [Thalassospira alkalitolerans]|uniref:methionyl-tRNA formyltransferase n=1 Tax=Thalassospira alkalitolerans TaxID=1293890 RepID=UPI0030EF59B1|tara:strand:- start:39533 stop:40417 length:885 start_codon:yes stop_codon:yes gene_type:complete